MEYYDLGTLFLTDEAGVWTWVVNQGAEWRLGPVLGPLFLEMWAAAMESSPIRHEQQWA